MPRFLSRIPAKYKQRKNFAKSSRSDLPTSSSSSSSLRQMQRECVYPWFEEKCLEEINRLSNPTLAKLSPCVFTNNRDENADSRVASASTSPTCSLAEYMEDGTTWGQFIDPWEAEEEIIRSSKILSQKVLLQTTLCRD